MTLTPWDPEDEDDASFRIDDLSGEPTPAAGLDGTEPVHRIDRLPVSAQSQKKLIFAGGSSVVALVILIVASLGTISNLATILALLIVLINVVYVAGGQTIRNAVAILTWTIKNFREQDRQRERGQHQREPLSTEPDEPSTEESDSDDGGQDE